MIVKPSGVVSPKERQLASNMDADRRVLEPLGVGVAARIGLKVRRAAQDTWVKTRSVPQVKVATRRALTELIPIIAASMVAGNLAGRLRAFKEVKKIKSDVDPLTVPIALAIVPAAYDGAIRMLRRRLNMSQEQLDAMQTTYEAEAIHVLDGASEEIEHKLQQVLAESTERGYHVKEGVQALGEAFDALGLVPSNSGTLEAIFRTQTQLAYGAGRWALDQHEEVQEILWGYKYVTVGDTRVRVNHAGLDGVTASKDDPIWNTIWPPNGWNCFPMGTPVVAVDVQWASKSFYAGEMIELVTVGGKRLSVTPNHPIATNHGWVAAGNLQEGDDLLCDDREVEFVRQPGSPFMSTRTCYEKQRPFFIQDCFESCWEKRIASRLELTCSPLDFHGDAEGFIGKVNIVDVNGVFVRRFRTMQAENLITDSFITWWDAHLTEESGVRHLDQFDTGSFSTRDSGPRGLALSDTIRPILSSPLQEFSGGSSPNLDTIVLQASGDRSPTDVVNLRKAIDALPRKVVVDQLLHVRRYPFRGHVYDLQTGDGLIIASGIVCSNCRCAVIPLYLEEKTHYPPKMFTFEGKTGVPGADPGFGYNPGQVFNVPGKPIALSLGSVVWKEELHPRDHGKFASKPGASGEEDPDKEGHEKEKEGIAKKVKTIPNHELLVWAAHKGFDAKQTAAMLEASGHTFAKGWSDDLLGSVLKAAGDKPDPGFAPSIESHLLGQHANTPEESFADVPPSALISWMALHKVPVAKAKSMFKQMKPTSHFNDMDDADLQATMDSIGSSTHGSKWHEKIPPDLVKELESNIGKAGPSKEEPKPQPQPQPEAEPKAEEKPAEEATAVKPALTGIEDHSSTGLIRWAWHKGYSENEIKNMMEHLGRNVSVHTIRGQKHAALKKGAVGAKLSPEQEAYFTAWKGGKAPEPDTTPADKVQEPGEQPKTAPPVAPEAEKASEPAPAADATGAKPAADKPRPSFKGIKYSQTIAAMAASGFTNEEIHAKLDPIWAKNPTIGDPGTNIPDNYLKFHAQDGYDNPTKDFGLSDDQKDYLGIAAKKEDAKAFDFTKHKMTHLMKSMGALGFTSKQASSVLDELGLPHANETLKTFVNKGKNGHPGARLSKDEKKHLLALKEQVGVGDYKGTVGKGKSITVDDKDNVVVPQDVPADGEGDSTAAASQEVKPDPSNPLHGASANGVINHLVEKGLTLEQVKSVLKGLPGKTSLGNDWSAMKPDMVEAKYHFTKEEKDKTGFPKVSDAAKKVADDVVAKQGHKVEEKPKAPAPPTGPAMDTVGTNGLIKLLQNEGLEPNQIASAIQGLPGNHKSGVAWKDTPTNFITGKADYVKNTDIAKNPTAHAIGEISDEQKGFIKQLASHHKKWTPVEETPSYDPNLVDESPVPKNALGPGHLAKYEMSQVKEYLGGGSPADKQDAAIKSVPSGQLLAWASHNGLDVDEAKDLLKMGGHDSILEHYSDQDFQEVLDTWKDKFSPKALPFEQQVALHEFTGKGQPAQGEGGAPNQEQVKKAKPNKITKAKLEAVAPGAVFQWAAKNGLDAAEAQTMLKELGKFDKFKNWDDGSWEDALQESKESDNTPHYPSEVDQKLLSKYYGKTTSGKVKKSKAPKDNPYLGNTSLPDDIQETQEPVTLGGSTGAKLMSVSSASDPTSNGKYVKKEYSGNSNQAKNEYLANQLYAALGGNHPNAAAATSKLVTDSTTGKTAVYNKFVPGMKELGGLSGDEQKKAMKFAQDHFVLDAFLSNWDSVGLSMDNMGWDGKKLHRIDNGGALLYRAQGSPKGASFGDTVFELKTMRDMNSNPTAAKVFGNLSDEDIARQVGHLRTQMNANPHLINQVVDSAGFNDNTSKLLKDTLNKRYQNLLAFEHKHNPQPSSIGNEPVGPGGYVPGTKYVPIQHWQPAPSPTIVAHTLSSLHAASKKVAGTLPPEEYQAVKKFTNSSSGTINSAIVNGKTSSTVSLLEKALNKMPSYSGWSCRGVSSLSSDLLAKWKSGEWAHARWPAFSSASVKPGSEFGSSGGAAFIVKDNKHFGRYVGGISSHTSEYELLYQKDSMFRVVGYAEGANGGTIKGTSHRLIFVLEEITDKNKIPMSQEKPPKVDGEALWKEYITQAAKTGAL